MADRCAIEREREVALRVRRPEWGAEPPNGSCHAGVVLEPWRGRTGEYRVRARASPKSLRPLLRACFVGTIPS